MATGGGTVQVSIAYQGGGARVVELLAAVQACRAAEADGRMEIVRLSGASAGAIAAAMHATECDIEKIIGEAPNLQSYVVRNFPANRLRKRNAIPRLLRGLALFDEKHVRELLLRMFEIGGVDAEKSIRDLVTGGARQLRIMRSDIRFNNASAATEMSEARLVDALVDSAAIPFAFRLPGVSKDPEILDGGLFQNLPARAAMDGLTSGQVALGFSFPKEDAPDLRKASLLGYGKAILSSLLDERIDDAAQQIKPSNIIQIPNRRSTFEFSRIFDTRLASQFSEDVAEISRRVETWIRTMDSMDGPDWHSDHPADVAEQAARTQAEVTKFYDDVSREGYHAQSISHEVIYQSFNREMPDIYTLRIEIHGDRNEGLQFLQFFFYDSDTGPIKKTKIEVLGSDGKPRLAMALPLKIAGKRVRGSLLCLDRPLSPTDVITVVKTEESFDGMIEYEANACCYQTVGLGPGRTTDRLSVTVHFPNEFNPAHFGDASSERQNDVKHLAEEAGLQVATTTSMSKTDRIGCRTITSETKIDEPSELRRFVKIGYYK